MNTLENVTLEISAKPLFQKDDAFVLDVFHNVFRHWWTLLKDAEHVSLLWWLSDGTDILEYDGNMDTVCPTDLTEGTASAVPQQGRPPSRRCGRSGLLPGSPRTQRVHPGSSHRRC